MMIDIPMSVLDDLTKLLRDLDLAAQQHGTEDENPYSDIYFDTEESGNENGDPVPYSNISRSTLELGSLIKKKLKL